MIKRNVLTDQQAKDAISTGEFADEIISSEKYTAVILTQDWCPQWTAMDNWLHQLETEESAEDPDIEIFEYVYNVTGIRNEFMSFKENVLGNSLIPYVRYYVDGRLVGDTNYISKDGFLSKFK